MDIYVLPTYTTKALCPLASRWAAFKSHWIQGGKDLTIFQPGSNQATEIFSSQKAGPGNIGQQQTATSNVLGVLQSVSPSKVRCSNEDCKQKVTVADRFCSLCGAPNSKFARRRSEVAARNQLSRTWQKASEICWQESEDLPQPRMRKEGASTQAIGRTHGRSGGAQRQETKDVSCGRTCWCNAAA